MKKIPSYIFPISLIIGIIILGYRKIIYHNEIWNNLNFNFDIIIIGLYSLWTMYEVRVSRLDHTRERVVSDYGTRELYGLCQALTVFSALWFDQIWHKPVIFHLIGFIIFIIGVLFRIWSIETLGKYYSHVVGKLTDHKIIDTGPYGLILHPAYAGMITAHIGISIFYFNYITCAIFLLLLIPSIIVRIIIEEKTLMTIEGYAEFAKKRKRILPFIW